MKDDELLNPNLTMDEIQKVGREVLEVCAKHKLTTSETYEVLLQLCRAYEDMVENTNKEGMN